MMMTAGTSEKNIARKTAVKTKNILKATLKTMRTEMGRQSSTITMTMVGILDGGQDSDTIILPTTGHPMHLQLRTMTHGFMTTTGIMTRGGVELHTLCMAHIGILHRISILIGVMDMGTDIPMPQLRQRAAGEHLGLREAQLDGIAVQP
jgi:hypothetical protein